MTFVIVFRGHLDAPSERAKETDIIICLPQRGAHRRTRGIDGERGMRDEGEKREVQKNKDNGELSRKRDLL